jgi:hypothetical protein
MLIDTQAHLCYLDFAEELPEAIERAGAVRQDGAGSRGIEAEREPAKVQF